jgi:transposase-like protein
MKIPCKCGHHFVKNGKNKHGDQKYLCKKCGASFVNSDRKVGRPCLFEVPLTDAEKTARNRAKKKRSPVKTPIAHFISPSIGDRCNNK